ncbi:MAG: hypothetical protein WAN35_00195 [Terracidiphilus sp.]
MSGSDVSENIFQELESNNPAIADAFSTMRHYRRLADLSDIRARALHIDPPRPGRKTYQERYRETNEMSLSDIDTLIAKREKNGQECGVLYRVKADKLESMAARGNDNLPERRANRDQVWFSGRNESSRQRIKPRAVSRLFYRDLMPVMEVHRSSFTSIFINIIVLTVFLVGIGFLSSIVRGPSIFNFLSGHWQSVLLPLGGICAGVGVVLLGSRIGSSPLGSITPPRTDTEDPLRELKDLSERTASRLRSAFSLQISAALAVGILFIILILWSVVMVSQNRILYASAFGSGSVAMLILTQWKWQPFDRINEARKLADNADILATGLRMRMATISAIPDLTERSRAQWQAVEEYLKSS